MRRFTFILGLLVLFIYLPMASFNTANAQCRTKASCYASDDTGYYILDYDGPYTPCNNSINWYVSFHRQNQTGAPNTIRTNITGDLFLQDYYSEDYDPNSNYNFSGSCYVGTASQTLYLKRMGDYTGNFSEIKVNISYYAGQPD